MPPAKPHTMNVEEYLNEVEWNAWRNANDAYKRIRAKRHAISQKLGLMLMAELMEAGCDINGITIDSRNVKEVKFNFDGETYAPTRLQAMNDPDQDDPMGEPQTWGVQFYSKVVNVAQMVTVHHERKKAMVDAALMNLACRSGRNSAFTLTYMQMVDHFTKLQDKALHPAKAIIALGEKAKERREAANA